MTNEKKVIITNLLDDINKIVNSTIWCFTEPHYILGKKNLVLLLLTIDEKIRIIKKILKEGI